MTGLKCVLLFSLVAGAFLACNAEVDDLDSLLRRVLEGIKAQNAQEAGNYLQSLTSSAKKDDGQDAVASVSVYDMEDATLLSSAGPEGPVQLTAQQISQIVAAFKRQRFDSLQSNGLTILGKTYRLSGTPSADSVVTFISRNGTINIRKASFGLVVAQSPKGGMTATVNAMTTK